jgi:hypothetical protein
MAARQRRLPTPDPGEQAIVEALARLLRDRPDFICDLVWELRDLIRSAAPEAAESVRLGGLCYHKAHEGGYVKGSVCQVAVFDDCVHLAFIHGAFLPDPKGLLVGNRKYKWHIPIRAQHDIRRAYFRQLIRAAVRFRPGMAQSL